MDEDWKDLIQRLEHHKIIIEGQTCSLEEDERVDESQHLRNSDIEKPLKDYIVFAWCLFLRMTADRSSDNSILCTTNSTQRTRSGKGTKEMAFIA